MKHYNLVSEVGYLTNLVFVYPDNEKNPLKKAIHVSKTSMRREDMLQVPRLLKVRESERDVM